MRIVPTSRFDWRAAAICCIALTCAASASAQLETQPKQREINGTLLFSLRQGGEWFMTDGSRVWTFDGRNQHPYLEPGDAVRLEGTPRSPFLRTDLSVSKIEFMGRGMVPPAKATTLAEAVAGGRDNEWVEVRGFVKGIRFSPRPYEVEFQLVEEANTLHAFVETDRAIDLAALETRFKHRFALFKGVVKRRPALNPDAMAPEDVFKARPSARLEIGDLSDITPEDKTAFQMQPSSIHELLSNGKTGKIVKLQDVQIKDSPTADRANLWDGTGEIAAATGGLPLHATDRLDLIGYTKRDGGRLVFHVADCKVYARDASGRVRKEARFTIHDAAKATVAEAAAAFPVRLRGRVAFIAPAGDGFFLEDRQAGIFIVHPAATTLTIGGAASVEGESTIHNGIVCVKAHAAADDGSFPSFTRINLRVTDRLGRLFEGRTISIEATVRSIEGSIWTLERLDDTFQAYVPLVLNERAEDYWRGTTVRVAGVYSRIGIPPSEGGRKCVWLARTADVMLLEGRREMSPLRLADTKDESLVDSSRNDPLVRVRGRVTAVADERSATIQDSSGGLRVRWATPESTRVNDAVEATGFLVWKDGGPELRYARCAPATGPIDPADPVDWDGAEDPARLDTLVRVEGVVASANTGAKPFDIVLRVGGRALHARLAAETFPADLAGKIAEGAVLRLTGIATRRDGQASLALRTAGDIEVLRRAGGGAVRFAATVVCLGILIALGAFWLNLLRHRMKEQGGVMAQLMEREEELEERYRELFENANDFMFTLDVEGRVTSINRAGENLMGYARGELLGRFLTEYVDAEDRNAVENMVESDVPVTYEVILYNRRREELCLEISSRPVSSDNLAIHVVGIGRDVTRRKITESELRRAFRSLKSHIENSPLAVIEWDRGFRVTRWSGQAEQMFGWKHEEVIFRHPSEWRFVHEEDRGRVEKVMTDLLNKTPRNFLSNRNYTMGGKVVHCEWYNSGLVDEHGELVSILSLVMDVTQRVESEAQRSQLEDNMRQVQKMEAVGRLAGGVAHDFNNLLTIINGNGHMLLQEGLTRDQRELVGQISQAGEKAAALTRQLLAFGRKQISAPRELDINAVVRELRKMLERLAGEAVRVRLDLDPALPPALMDPTLTEQIIYNLIVNARDAMPQGGEIVLRTRAVKDGSIVRLEVEDSGTGMDEQTKAKIFEPFFTTKALGKGTGLGLATVYSIVHQAGGVIEVLSRPGEGALFRVDIPRSVGSPVVAKGDSHTGGILSPVANRRPASGIREAVLLVEDEDGLRLLARRVLEMNGYIVHVAADAAEALRVYAAIDGKIDILITDVIMPEVSGVQLADQIRRTVPNLKVVFMSGYTDDDVIHQGVLMEEVHFLQKPFSPPSLLAKVQEVLSLEASVAV